MKKTTKLIASILIIGLFLYGALRIISGEQSYKPVLTKEVIKVQNGFGYQIYSGEKLLVQQEFIPAIKGEKPFSSAQEAEKVADLVIDKIKSRTSPQISVQELRDLHIVTLE